MTRMHWLLRGVLALFAIVTAAATAATERPLLIPGKQSLYQRVIAVPGAQLVDAPGAPTGKPVTPFTAYYVYAREGGAVQVGTGRYGNTAGWIAAAQTIDWNQGLTVAFRNPDAHSRSLLFRDAATLKALAQGPDLTTYRRLYQEAEDGRSGPDSPVVAIQPARHVDLSKEFIEMILTSTGYSASSRVISTADQLLQQLLLLAQ